mmetsp:Transcript_24978/g.75643  ORF Transcript_24978/g.75643 Transcript_24978/m.75643 type:complete len:205 (-) Transcript_24978:45-659(-)
MPPPFQPVPTKKRKHSPLPWRGAYHGFARVARPHERPSRGRTPRGPSRSHVLRRRPNVASRATPSSADTPAWRGRRGAICAGGRCLLGEGILLERAVGLFTGGDGLASSRFYFFVGIAIVCDDFFVEAIEEVVEVLKIPEDVAGATFMAVGSSAAEFFTVIRPARDRVGRGRRRHRRRAAVFNSMTIVGLTGIFAGHLDQQRLA